MLRWRFGLVVGATLALVFSASAAAATPRDIYRDLADNGALDAQYSEADVSRALRLPAASLGVGQPSRPLPVAKTTEASFLDLPFGRIDALLLALAAAPVLAFALRRRYLVSPTAPGNSYGAV
jgi:hypothetical protein